MPKVQFGIGTMTFGGQEIGYLQNVSLDFNFDIANLYSGTGLYPVDVRTHTGTVTGTCEFAKITAAAFEKLLGGTRTSTQVAGTNTDSPTTFQLTFSVTTDSVPLTVTLNKARSTKLSMAFVRDGHVIPNFDFSAEADASGNVFTIDLGVVS